jgi:hypothetical protein
MVIDRWSLGERPAIKINNLRLLILWIFGISQTDSQFYLLYQVKIQLDSSICIEFK